VSCAIQVTREQHRLEQLAREARFELAGADVTRAPRVRGELAWESSHQVPDPLERHGRHDSRNLVLEL
jgi:hypothetical protein